VVQVSSARAGWPTGLPPSFLLIAGERGEERLRSCVGIPKDSCYTSVYIVSLLPALPALERWVNLWRACGSGWPRGLARRAGRFFKARLPRDQNVFCRTPGKVRLKSDTAGALIQHPPLEENRDWGVGSGNSGMAEIHVCRFECLKVGGGEAEKEKMPG
jgi:hypothetical protein